MELNLQRPPHTLPLEASHTHTHHSTEVTVVDIHPEDGLPGGEAGGETGTQTEERRVSLGSALRPDQRYITRLTVQFHVCNTKKPQKKHLSFQL